MWLISWRPIVQQSSPCYHNFLKLTLSYHSKVNLVGPLDAMKKEQAGFIYVFKIGFPTSLLSKKKREEKNRKGYYVFPIFSRHGLTIQSLEIAAQCTLIT